MTATVRGRLLRLAALLLLPGLAIGVLLTWQVFTTARRGAETALREAAGSLDQLVDREFVQAELLLRVLAATGELRRGDMAGFDRLARATAIMDGAVVLADRSGQELVDTFYPAGAALPKVVAASGWDSEAVGTRIIEPLAPRPGSDALWVQVVMPVGGEAGRHAYDLKLVVPVASLQAILTRATLPAGWVSSIMDTGGRLAARSVEARTYVGRHAGRDLMAGLAAADEGARDGLAIDGTHVLLAFSRSAQSRWTVAVSAPRRLVAQAGLVSTSLLAALGSASVLAVLGALGVARRIARPVEALSEAARAMGEGRAWAPIPPGLAQTDAVAAAMAGAARALSERQAALGELNASLVARVEERTRELADANGEIEAQRRWLADILDDLPAGVLVHRADGTLAFFNREAGRLLNLSVGQTAYVTWPAVSQAGVTLSQAQAPTALACRGVATERALLSVVCGARPAVELEVSARPLRGEAGAVLFAVTILQDVTERLAGEEARRRSQRLEAVGQLTGGVAHEFNNLLMAVSGCLELLEKPVERLGDARASALLGNAARAAGRGSRLTTQLLAFARRQTLQMVAVDLDALVLGIRELLEGTLGRGVQVEVQPGAGAWPALADPAQVELMLLNLAINARDAMAGGGRLTLRTGCVRMGAPVRAEDPPAGEHAMIEVSDTGEGMDAHVLARAFEPFFTTKDVGRGSGLGLPQVLGVAQQMGGGVTITSQKGVGTTVGVYLPRAAAAAVVVAAGEGSEAAEPSRRLTGVRVLLVDDDLDVRVVARAVLEELGALVIEAEGGAAALLALRTRRVDLVLADLTMPGMSGLELAGEVAAVVPGLPLVLMTGYGPDALAEPGAGIRATLQKPFRAEVLAACLAEVLGLAEVKEGRVLF